MLSWFECPLDAETIMNINTNKTAEIVRCDFLSKQSVIYTYCVAMKIKNIKFLKSSHLDYSKCLSIYLQKEKAKSWRYVQTN